MCNYLEQPEVESHKERLSVIKAISLALLAGGILFLFSALMGIKL